MPFPESDYERSWKMQTKGVMLYPVTLDGLYGAAQDLLAAVRLGLEWAESDGESDESNLIGWMERAFRVAARAAIAKAEWRTSETPSD